MRIILCDIFAIEEYPRKSVALPFSKFAFLTDNLLQLKLNEAALGFMVLARCLRSGCSSRSRRAPLLQSCK